MGRPNSPRVGTIIKWAFALALIPQDSPERTTAAHALPAVIALRTCASVRYAVCVKSTGQQLSKSVLLAAFRVLNSVQGRVESCAIADVLFAQSF